MKEKLTEIYTLRISESMKEMIDSIPADLKKQMNQEIKIILAKYFHLSKFDPKDYLEEQDNE